MEESREAVVDRLTDTRHGQEEKITVGESRVDFVVFLFSCFFSLVHLSCVQRILSQELALAFVSVGIFMSSGS